ncbi:MAG TPA: glutamine synthetase [Candidatus Acetothermia bacterium]|nr:glutamine synthetase [Candidatus Acetothermia bacterium]
MINLNELQELINQEEVETVIVSFPDMYGRLLGKRVSATFFLSDVAEQGINACDYLLASDMEMSPSVGYEFTSWEKGYGDIKLVPDWNTLRIASWLSKTALVLCDVTTSDGLRPVAIAPRTILARQVEKAKAAGFLPQGATELEMFVFRDSYGQAREKGFSNLQPFSSYIEDYHILQAAREEPLIGAIRHHLEQSGIPVETSKGEWGAGQHEINIRYSPLVEMGDRTVLFKEICKEIAIQQGVSLTFMAKWSEDAAGNSMHVHSSLWEMDGEKSIFAGNERVPGLPVTCSPLFRWYLGGLIAHARELALFFAPNVNSYKRYQQSSFAPTRIAWAYDNRSVGFRVLGSGNNLRVECRIPGADANPYLALSAILAAGLDGIENRTEPPEAMSGNAYSASEAQLLPGNISQAIRLFEGSSFVRAAFGDDVVNHYVQFARQEEEAFSRAVTDWERARFFERI